MHEAVIVIITESWTLPIVFVLGNSYELVNEFCWFHYDSEERHQNQSAFANVVKIYFSCLSQNFHD